MMSITKFVFKFVNFVILVIKKYYHVYPLQMSRLIHGLPFQITMILSEFHRRVRADITIFNPYKRYVNHDCISLSFAVR